MIAVWDWKKSESASPHFFDCMLAEFLLSDGRYYLNQESTMQRYGVNDLDMLRVKQEERLKKLPKVNQLLQTIEFPLVPILKQMERNGIAVDTKQLEQLGVRLQHELASVTDQIYQEAQSPINLSSPLQVGKLLVETFGVPLFKKPSGSYSTGEPELIKHADQFPIIRKILKFRELAKLKSTYVEGLLKKIDSDNKIHTTYNQTGAITGRLSSSNPNLQNIPANSDIGRQIKSCFIATTGNQLLAFDYSQQELRILAHITKEPALVEAFRSGRDIHIATAAKLFAIPYEKVSKEQRSAAKTINFGVLYGMGSYGLSQALQISQEGAAAFIKNFFNTFPAVRDYYTQYLNQAKEQDFAETLLGRRRYVFIQPSKSKEIDNATRRELTNFPIQGTAADLMKKAMIDIDREVIATHPNVRLLLQIHDELVFEVPKQDPAQLHSLVQLISSCMEKSFILDVPMKVEAKVGDNWGSLQGV